MQKNSILQKKSPTPDTDKTASEQERPKPIEIQIPADIPTMNVIHPGVFILSIPINHVSRPMAYGLLQDAMQLMVKIQQDMLDIKGRHKKPGIGEGIAEGFLNLKGKFSKMLSGNGGKNG